MPGDVRETIQNLNEKCLHASAWIFWKPVGSREFQIVSQMGFGTDDLEQLTAAWEGHDELLQQVYSTKTLRRASANNEQIEESNTSALNLLVSAVVSQENVIGLLELFFQQPEQIETVIQENLLQKALSQIATVLETDTTSTPKQQFQLATYLQELVSQTRSDQLPHVIANAICGKYEVGRCSLFSLSNQSVRLQGVSGHQDYESRSETIRELHDVVRDHANSLTDQNPVLSLPDEELIKLKSQTAILVRLEKIFQGADSSNRHQGVMLLEYFEQQQVTGSSDRLPTDLMETLPLWKLAIQSSRLKLPDARRSKKRTTLLSIIFIAVVCLLVFLPVDLKIRVPGQVVPVVRHHLFAPESGLIKIEDLHLPATEHVLRNQHLLTITNQELVLQRGQLEGKIATLAEEIRSLKSRRPERDTERPRRLSIDQDLSIRLAEASTQLKGLQLEKELLQRRIQTLQIRSPHQGRLLSWDAKNQLAGRPVSRGQLLLTIGDSEGEWEVLADVSQHDIGPLKRISQADSIPFTITLDTNANRKWNGELASISPVVRQQNPDEYVLPVKGKLTQEIEDVLPGSRVTMRISCGKYPLGYVLFRGPIDAICHSMTW